MKKEDLLTYEFLKQFKTGKDHNGFLAQLQKYGLEAILNGELDPPSLACKSFRVIILNFASYLFSA